MYVVQISDTHITTDGTHAAAREGALVRSVQELNRLDPPPLAVLHTGDVAHTGRKGEYAGASRILAKLKAPLLIAVGNRDDREECRAAFPRVRELDRGGPFVQYAVDLGPVRVVALDTLSIDHGLGEACENRLVEASRLLAEVEPPTIVILHHPPVALPSLYNASQFRNAEEADRLVRLIARQAGVLGVLAGHIHREDVVPIGATHLSTAPSLALDLRKGRYTGAAGKQSFFHRHDIGERGLITSRLLVPPPV
ncbi:MAG TPA: metallophosphoesterase [Hyphomicrobiaceae bacterium]|nr:metallophosphoesterase [Hyphomicrobiaceae bacterium]